MKGSGVPQMPFPLRFHVRQETSWQMQGFALIRQKMQGEAPSSNPASRTYPISVKEKLQFISEILFPGVPNGHFYSQRLAYLLESERTHVHTREGQRVRERENLKHTHTDIPPHPECEA